MMVQIKDKEGNVLFTIDEDIHKLIKRIKEKINDEDQDAWVCFGGDTGTGKSLKAQHWGYIIDENIDISNICFNISEFISAVTSKKKTVIIADEGISLFFNRSVMTKEGRLMSELAAQIRQRNLAVFICIPNVLSLDSLIQDKLCMYVDVFESRLDWGNKIVTYKGNVEVYPEIGGANFKTKLIHYLKKKKSNPNVKAFKPNPPLRQKGNPVTVKPFYPTGEEAYKEKKESILKKYEEKNKMKVDKYKDGIYKMVHHLHKNYKMSMKEISMFAPFQKTQIQHICKTIEESNQNMEEKCPKLDK